MSSYMDGNQEYPQQQAHSQKRLIFDDLGQQLNQNKYQTQDNFVPQLNSNDTAINSYTNRQPGQIQSQPLQQGNHYIPSAYSHQKAPLENIAMDDDNDQDFKSMMSNSEQLEYIEQHKDEYFDFHQEIQESIDKLRPKK